MNISYLRCLCPCMLVKFLQKELLGGHIYHYLGTQVHVHELYVANTCTGILLMQGFPLPYLQTKIIAVNNFLRQLGSINEFNTFFLKIEISPPSVRTIHSISLFIQKHFLIQCIQYRYIYMYYYTMLEIWYFYSNFFNDELHIKFFCLFKCAFCLGKTITRYR